MPGVTAEETVGEGVLVTNGRNGGGAGDGQQPPRKSKVGFLPHMQVASPENQLKITLTSQRCEVPPDKRWVGPKVRKSLWKPFKGGNWVQVEVGGGWWVGDATVLQKKELETVIG